MAAMKRLRQVGGPAPLPSQHNRICGSGGDVTATTAPHTVWVYVKLCCICQGEARQLRRFVRYFHFNCIPWHSIAWVQHQQHVHLCFPLWHCLFPPPAADNSPVSFSSAPSFCLVH
eukprot:GGOE01012593.1.p5 GENE.GGOE01012593.1~~GGOE01012593.1.p5  ORF type:complete len:116 (-),score=2.45 GGOE01012593.1:1012-1359(-)